MQRERWTLARGVAWDRAPGARVRAVLVAFVAGGPAAALRLEASGLPALLVDLRGQTPAG